MCDQKHIHENKDPDSIEIGTPGKNGCIKVYGSFSDPEAFKKKIDNCQEVRDYFLRKLSTP
jgi:hypothetical protein